MATVGVKGFVGSSLTILLLASVVLLCPTPRVYCE